MGKGQDVRVTTSNDFAVGALGVGQGQKTDHLCNGGGSGAAGEKVASNGGIVWATDTLDPDIVRTVLAL